MAMISVRNELPYMQLKERYVKMTMDGRKCVMEVCDVADMIASEEPGTFTLEDVYMTPSEFENLSEFVGW